jgi:hypothetical protein
MNGICNINVSAEIIDPELVSFSAPISMVFSMITVGA